MKAVSSLMVLGVALVTSCSTQRPAAKAGAKFYESRNADVIVRYYSESLSRILKPLQMEGPFLTSFDRAGVLKLAKKQPGRELAVVVLLQFNASERVKQSWFDPLKQMGYKRVVFLRAENGRKLDGLRILEDPSGLAQQPNPSAVPKEQATTSAGG